MSTTYSTRIITGIQRYVDSERAAFVRRISVILLLLYFAVMVDIGRFVEGNFVDGFYCRISDFSGFGLFPLPFHYSRGIMPMILILDPFQSFIYIIFIGHDVWMAWMFLGIIYIMMPVVLWAYNTLGRPKSMSTHARKEVDIITKLVAVLAILFSIMTYIINLENYGPFPLILVLGLSIACCVLFDETKNKVDER